MERKVLTGIVFTLCLLGVSALTSYTKVVETSPGVITVPDDYSTIQAAINAANSWDTIYVREGVYHEQVVVNKTVSVVGEDKNLVQVDGSGLGYSFAFWVDADSAKVKGFTIRCTDTYGSGVMVNSHRWSRVEDNIITSDTRYGIWVANSNSTYVLKNTVYAFERGITLNMSYYSNVDDNTFSNSDFGIILDMGTTGGNDIRNNTIQGNLHGLTFYHIPGYPPPSPQANWISHNNFINNDIQVDFSQSYANNWDEGYPAGGNYWSDYTGVDLFWGPNQDVAGSDGIGDTPYTIDGNNRDNYPLMSPGQVTNGPIYIRADGSIDPPNAPIQRDGDLYTLTRNIVVVAEGIAIQRDNMTLNGAGYTILGTEVANVGIDLTDRSNVTIKNINIQTFTYGIQIYNMSAPAGSNSIFGNNITNNVFMSTGDAVGINLIGSSNNTIFGNNIAGFMEGSGLIVGSSNNTIVGNNITNKTIGIDLSSGSNNTLYENNIEANGYGIYLGLASDNSIFRNNVTRNSSYGIYLTGASSNTICENNIEANHYGIWLEDGTTYNSIYHNNFIANSQQAHVVFGISEIENSWDHGYPEGGNYWSPPTYMGKDVFSGPNQNIVGSDGIGDTPYLINAPRLQARDRYPLMARVLATRIPGDINGDGKTDIYDLFLLGQNYGKTNP